MSSAVTEPTNLPGLIEPGGFSYARDLDRGRLYILRLSRTAILVMSSGADHTVEQSCPVEVLEYEHPNGTTFALDFGEPVDALSLEERRAIEYLREHGRTALATNCLRCWRTC